MPSIILSKEEASIWPFWALVFFSVLFAFGVTPALIIGFLDKEYRGLFLITAVAIVPQMVGVWIATWFAWKERKQG